MTIFSGDYANDEGKSGIALVVFDAKLIFIVNFNWWKKQMAIVRMMRVFLESGRTCFLSFSGPRSDGLLTRVGIALSALHVTLSLDTFLKIIGITRIIQHYST